MKTCSKPLLTTLIGLFPVANKMFPIKILYNILTVYIFYTQVIFATNTKEKQIQYDSPNGALTLYLDDSLDAYLSKHCFKDKNKGQKPCLARKFLSSITLKTIHLNTKYAGQSPADIICDSLPGAQSIIIRDKRKNQFGACKFKDGSTINSGSLIVWAKKNSI